VTVLTTAAAQHVGADTARPVDTDDLRTARPERRVAAAVGALFLLATVTFATGEALLNSVLDAPAFLASAGDHRAALAGSALLAFVQGVAIVAVAVLMYPVLRRHRQQRLAIAYLALKAVEFAATLLYVAVPLVVLRLSDRVGDGTLSPSTARQLAGLFPAQHEVSIVLMYLVVSFGGWALAVAMWRARLVPRPIAVLGVVGYPALFVGCVLTAFGVGDVLHGPGSVALAPGGLFELVMPLWLIAKGFRTDTDPR
jgi:hypothetical protein